MRKSFLSLLILFILFGCASNSPDKIHDRILETLSEESTRKYDNRINNFSEYIKYYLPADCAEKDFNDTTITIKYNDSIIVYNINIADIINTKYYNSNVMADDGFFNDDYLFLESNSTFIGKGGEEFAYIIKVYRINDEYVMFFKTRRDVVYAYATSSDVQEVIRKIFIICKCLDVKQSQVIENYSNKDVIDYQKKQIDLFDYVIPVSGYLTELLDKNGEKPSQIPSIDENEEISEEFEETLE